MPCAAADHHPSGFTQFGAMPDGDPIWRAELRSTGIEAAVISFGAVLADLRIKVGCEWRRVVLGFPTADPYLRDPAHIGAIAGRYGGRIREGCLRLGGRVTQLTRNVGRHHAHGGKTGFGRRNWRAVRAAPDHAIFALSSPAGEEGYPGHLETRCKFRLEPIRLRIDISARASVPTPVNLIHHSYFNLDGGGTIDRHALTIPAGSIIESDAGGLPTGRMVEPAGALDFRRKTRLDPRFDYDASFRLAPALRGIPCLAARLEGGRGDLAMEVWTSEPGLHLYDGHKLGSLGPGYDDSVYDERRGMCLEPTRFSDSPNQPSFPNTIVSTSAPYRQTSEFRFTELAWCPRLRTH